MPDSTVDNNTAVANDAISDETGSYVAELKPGTYLIKVDETVNESGIDVKYTYSGRLLIQDDEVTVKKNIIMTREEKTK